MVVGALVLLRSTVGQVMGVLLAALLLLSTPAGTGQGPHANVLLHPVLPHVHLLDGRMVTDEQLVAAMSARRADALQLPPPGGTALGGGGGADAAGLGLALGPTLPDAVLSLAALAVSNLAPTEAAAPTEFRDAPQDPPPDPRA
jgi:hypothetical protein